MFYAAPEKNMKLVEIIAVTDDECVAGVLDGFSINWRL